MLTEPMKAQLASLIALRLPKSWHGFPGHPATTLDMRSVAALEKRGLVESVVHKWSPDKYSRERAVLCYRATDAGRAILVAG